MTAREEQFRELFSTNYGAVLAYALRRTNKRADAEDIVAETFAVAWRRLEVVPQDDHDQRLWLYGVARRTLANHRRGVSRAMRLTTRLDPPMVAGSADEALEQAADVTAALQAMSQLTDSDQELLRLALWEELSHGDIAKVTGTSVANVAVRLHRAKRRLRARFDRTSDGLRECDRRFTTTAAPTADPEPTR